MLVPELTLARYLTCRVNITTGEPSDRAMTTGLHTVRDIYCTKCNEVLGWKYGELVFVLAGGKGTDALATGTWLSREGV